MTSTGGRQFPAPEFVEASVIIALAGVAPIFCRRDELHIVAQTGFGQQRAQNRPGPDLNDENGEKRIKTYPGLLV